MGRRSRTGARCRRAATGARPRTPRPRPGCVTSSAGLPRASLARVASRRLDISYDGSGFSGWASQPGRRTVQGELETALETVLREPVALTVAGRTDAGVHALGQVASFDLAGAVPSDLAWRLNGLIGEDVAVRGVTRAPDGFDARRWARSRSYVYRVLAAPQRDPFERGRALWVSRRLDLDALDRCAAALPGEHDFTAFTPTETDHVRFTRRIFAAGWTRSAREGGSILEFRITADAFLRGMVRALVGTMLDVAEGRRDTVSFERLLAGAPRSEGGRTAPAHGLYLERIEMGDGPTEWVGAPRTEIEQRSEEER
ncbi:tRNA pseudouridine(38-40) synthase TruA [Thermoleophilia bacterium SCSIO 60948]|nr:tRNA pseudouridine(38-40) synthase TruA [Thermoleophilia bacterium SCSIO 60948]